MKQFIFLTIFLLISFSAQPQYWQQNANYKMDVTMNVNTYQYQGTQRLVYTNNSPDTLRRVFYHLYFNAFQPGSEMDARIQAIPDPDPRMLTNTGTQNLPEYESKISTLKPHEIGYLRVTSLKQNGKLLYHEEAGTVLEVQLNKPLLPRRKTVLEMTFEGQVPVQVRRSGRNSSDSVALSMTQWYPKMAEYDFEGWHADPYIGREFHGVWGDYDVTFHIDKRYTIAGTGVLQNPHEIGHGYPSKRKLKLPKGDLRSWNFKAQDVHDYAWAADPDYTHDIIPLKNGPELHFFYKKNAATTENWKDMQAYAVKAMKFLSNYIGPYPWPQYSIIQGGDGGMEYAMCTLIAGNLNLHGLTRTMVHEMIHAWFQHLLATNESKHAWMDEGFTSYITAVAMRGIYGNAPTSPSRNSYNGYFYMINKGIEEPLTTHADRFKYNGAYGVSAYVKGKIFLSQLEYVIGVENLKKTIKRFYNDFQFKHPTPNDFIRTAEKVSGVHLGWYLNEFAQTTHTVDYGVKTVNDSIITLERIGPMPLPVDVSVTYENDKTETFHIPLRMMRGHKPTTATVLNDWPWVFPTYTFTSSGKVKSVQLDPDRLTADVDPENDQTP